MTLINRNYTFLWLGQTTSAVGDMVFSAGLMVWVGSLLFLEDPRAPVVSSSVMIVVAVTAVLLGPAAGVFVERWNKRRVMMRVDLVRMVIMLAFCAVLLLAGTDRLRSLSLWVLVPIGLVAVANTAAAQFFAPARMVLIRDVVPESHRGRATGYAQATQATATILGPPLAAVLVVATGVEVVLLLNAATFLASFACVAMIRVAETPEASEAPEAPAAAAGKPAKSGFAAEFAAGLRFIARDPALRAIVILAAMSATGIGALNALELYFVQENLHGGAEWYGFINAGFGGGLILGGLLGGKLGDRFGHRAIVWLSMSVFGLLYVVYSQQVSVWPGLVLNILFGVSLGTVNATVFPLLLEITPRELLARVGSVINPVNQAGSLISISAAGALAATLLRDMDVSIGGYTLGTYDTILLAGGLLCLGAGLYAAAAFRAAAPVGDGEKELSAETG